MSITDANGHTTSYFYDGLDRRTTTTDALGHASSTAYDAVGNVISWTICGVVFFFHKIDEKVIQAREKFFNADDIKNDDEEDHPDK